MVVSQISVWSFITQVNGKINILIFGIELDSTDCRKFGAYSAVNKSMNQEFLLQSNCNEL